MLSLFFRASLGIERIFHFETLDDPGFAILSGGKKVISRSRLGGLVRAVTTEGVKKLTRATEAWGALRNRRVTEPRRARRRPLHPQVQDREGLPYPPQQEDARREALLPALAPGAPLPRACRHPR
ncbi:hypothetical protein WMF20_45870 [Sorangium sp. So ce834]|uniref:hypothetical protein n=1 Tax=Sorangium sp. So ce834 TaxID=3133321 RepID=UPI003F5D9473